MVRFFDNQWLIKQRFVKLEVLAKGMNSEERHPWTFGINDDGAAVTESGLHQSKKNLVVSLCETLNKHFRAVDLVLQISCKQEIP